MADRYSNPFQALDVVVPSDCHEEVSRYSQRESGSVPDRNPFPRMVDVWFLALCLAARRNLKPVELAGRDTRKVVEGSILSSDPWRVNLLTLVAIAYAEDIEIANEPRRMMAMANGLAAAGFPFVFEMVKDGDQDPIWNLSDGIEAAMPVHPKNTNNSSSI